MANVMVIDIACACGMVHRLKVGEMSLCQCGAEITAREDSAGYITPWAFGAKGAPRITNMKTASKPIYKPIPAE